MTDIATIDPFGLPKVRLKTKHLLPNSSGLYFVLLEQRILYVGKTERGFKNRWGNADEGCHSKHHRLLQFQELSPNVWISYLELLEKGKSLDSLERQAIAIFSPELNRTYVPKKNEPARRPANVSIFAWIANQLSITEEIAMLYFPDGEMSINYPDIPSDSLETLREKAKNRFY